MGIESARLTILAEGAFGVETAKTASSVIRYQPERVGSVIDSRFAGATVGDTVGFGGDIPIVASFAEALTLSPAPEALLVGIAPQGGRLPDEWRTTLVAALDAGLDIISGLHFFLADDAELSAAAARRGRALVDLRRPPGDLPVGAGRVRETEAFRVLTVGTDCNTGKMTVSLELQRSLAARGVEAAFAATGQTGILLAGSGIAVDAVVSDFISGAAERLTLEAAAGPAAPSLTTPGSVAAAAAANSGVTSPAPIGSAPASTVDASHADVTVEAPGGADGTPDVVLIEGQGSLMHPGYSGVTLGLLHGTLPEAMILTWMPSRPRIYGGNHGWVVLPELDETIRRYEDALSWVCPEVPGRVIGVSVATWDLPEDEARAAVRHARDVTGLPATDPIRFGPTPLADAIVTALESARPRSEPGSRPEPVGAQTV